ncbi:uncharacterized protein LOC125240090 [Leguminivora glycinivorella]|uniref:uncharacterized protein LOC125240090 n=1 Tax=Leguminivora glycinivorella TaxID=1035111 RepID=UPI00200D0597|nr:uncharacterized protein LOC125240090 [Leguminivora glycinivorella]
MFTEGTVKEEHQCDSSARKQPKELSDQGWAPAADPLIQQPVLVDSEDITDSDSVSKDSCIIHTSLNKLKQEYNGDTDRDNRASDNGSESENADVHITRERISGLYTFFALY